MPSIIDPRIPLQVETPDLKSYDQVATEHLALQEKRLKAKQDVQDYQDRQMLRSILQKNGGDLEASLPQIMQLNPRMGLDIRKELSGIQEHADKLKRDRIDFETKQSDYLSEAESADDYAKRIYTLKKAGYDTKQFENTQWSPSLKQKKIESDMARQTANEKSQEDARLAAIEDKRADNERQYQLAVAQIANLKNDNERADAKAKADEAYRQKQLVLEKERNDIARIRANKAPSGGQPVVIQTDTGPGLLNKGTGVVSPITRDGQQVNAQLPAQVRTQMANATKVVSHVDEAKSLIEAADQKGLLGPMMGRWSDFLSNKVGSTGNKENDYLLGQLAFSLKGLKTGFAMVHGGARGGGSPTLLAAWDQVLNSKNMTKERLFGALDQEKGWLDTYSKNPNDPTISQPSAPSAPPPSSEGEWIDLGNGVRVRKK